MAVQSDTSRIQYAGNNSTTTSYAVPFVFQENSHLKAIARTSAGVESVVTLTNHTGAGNVNGGTVRAAVAVPTTSTLTIYREVPATQTTTYAEGGDFPAASHERALDKLTFLVQQLGRAVARCVRLTDAAPESSAIETVPNRFFGTDSTGAIAMVAGVNAAPESITNASISPTAAIAGTKIAPNFGSQNVVTTGSFSAQEITSEAPSSAAAITVRRASNNSAPPYQFFHKSRGTLVAKTAVQNNDDCGGIFFRGYDGATDVSAASIIATVDGTPSTNDMPARLVFSTTADGSNSPTERMRITNDGAVCVGSEASIDAFNGTDTGTSISGGAVVISRSDNTALRIRRVASDGAVVGFNRSGVTSSVGIISVTTTSTNYGTTSDYRLKDNPQPMTGALSRLSEVKPVTFIWKSNGQQSDGFIAHELQSVVPEAVTGTKDAVDADGNPEYQNVDASKIVPLLVAAIQELSAKVAALEEAQ